MLCLGPQTLSSVERGSSYEWLVANGLGGFAMGTGTGMNTRRYHGLLVASMRPPVERWLLVHQLETIVRFGSQEYSLHTSNYHGQVTATGYRYLVSFAEDPFPTYVWQLDGAILRQHLFMPHGENRVYVIFEVVAASQPLSLTWRPLVNARDYHGTTSASAVQSWSFAEEGWEGLLASVPEGTPAPDAAAGESASGREEGAEGQAAVHVRVIQAFPGAPRLVLSCSRQAPLSEGPSPGSASRGAAGRATGRKGGPAAGRGVQPGPSLRGRAFPPAGAVVYRPERQWYYGLHYDLEQERGLACEEDAFAPGSFVVTLSAGEAAVFSAAALPAAGSQVFAERGCSAAATDGPEAREEDLQRLGRLGTPAAAWGARRREEERLRALWDKARPHLPDTPLSRVLVRAADQFVVQRQSTGTCTILAGYPWFTDWGRDAMISLPGLTLATGRWDEARQILSTFARNRRHGLLPNVFSDFGEDALYNTVDASLWFVQAVYAYWQATGDEAFVRQEMLPALHDVLHFYQEGTDFHIHMDRDGLITAGERGVQLTWMDAKVGDWVVTPREGKAVEINALWYNALRVMSVFEPDGPWQALADHVQKRFREAFWWSRRKCLYDGINPNGEPVEDLRPNQILAVSLPFSPLTDQQARQVVDAVFRWLYTPYGLRSLEPDAPAFCGIYQGDQVVRDAAYHQGTVWGWLLGPFITAWNKVYGASPQMLEAFLQPIQAALHEAGLGQLSEIYDGARPHHPRGCPAQAWSVAEILRVLWEAHKSPRK